MKKTVAFMLAAALLAALAFSGCAQDGAGGEKRTLSVFNWGDYIDEDVLAMFEEETGIEVTYSMFETNEDLYTKITSPGGEQYDVIFPSDYIIERLINEGLLAELDYENIPNMSLIDEKYLDLDFDPDNTYSVPYMWGTVGILYNTTMVDTEIDSWYDLWDEHYSKKIFMMDSMRDSIGVALKMLGYSMNTRTDAEIQEAADILRQQKPLVLAYTGDEVKDKMIAGEAALAVLYSGDAATCIEQNPDLAYVVPVEGSNIWFDNMCVLAGSQHKSEAEEFINFMCRTDIAEMNRAYINYSSPQREVYEALDDEIKSDPVQYPADEIYQQCEVYLDLGEYTQIYDQIWTEIVAY
mgnify:CR=1 FL=1|jgi:spermidine/putrescine transport system substrate-binding protein